MSMNRVLLLAVIAGSLGTQPACSRAARDQPDSARSTVAVVADSAPAFQAVNPELSAVPARDSVSAHPVDWTVDLAMARLSSAGLAPKLMGPVQVKHMNVAGTLIGVAGAELEIYLYGDSNASAQDIDRFDKLMAMPGGGPVMWEKPPAIVTENNMVIMVLTTDPAVRERVRKVFTLSQLHTFPGSAQ